MLLLFALSLTATSTDVRGAAEIEVAIDGFRASSSQAPPGAGSPEDMVAQELGMRARLHASELGRRLSLDVDYQGREPVGGDVQNFALRKLYRAELRYAFDAVTLGVGRFIAPAMSFLPIDGVNAELRFGALAITPYAGRRAISSSLRNLPFDALLPAAGASAIYAADGLFVELNGAYAEDRLVVTRGSAGEGTADVPAASGYLRAQLRLLEGALRLGARAALAQRAEYLIGPRWSDLAADVLALDLLTLEGSAEWRPLASLRVRYGAQHQRAAVVSGLTRRGQELLREPDEQPFTDQRLRASYRLLELGWLRADGRLRLRPDRSELRGALTADLDALLDLEWMRLGARGHLAAEGVSWDDPSGKPDLDRVLWSIALAAAAGAFELETGVSFIDRSATPISSRVFSAPDRVEAPEDLAPFVLDAQRVLFARAFYGGSAWFAGLDLELNLVDASELRALLQVGARWGTEW